MTHPPLLFDIILINWPSHHQNLGVYLDEKSNSISISKKKKKKLEKPRKVLALIKEFHQLVPRKALLIIYKSFITPNLYFWDVIYDHPNNDSFSDIWKQVQYSPALAITGANKGISGVKFYKELGLKSLKSTRRLHVCVCCIKSSLLFFQWILIRHKIEWYWYMSMQDWQIFFLRTSRMD